MNNLAIIIPVYNEEKNIFKLLKEWLKVVPKYHKNKYKIFVINDGSTDKTHKEIYKIRNKSIYYIKQKNIGHGNSCLKGYKLAIKKNFDLIFQIDGDNQCDPKFFKHFIQLIKKKDAVFGYRNKRDDGFIRKIFSFVLSLLIFFRTFTFVKDSNVPYRIIKKKVLEKVIDDIPSKVMLKNVYLSYLIQRKYKIEWVNIRFRKRVFGKTNYNFINLIIMTLNLLINLK